MSSFLAGARVLEADYDAEGGDCKINLSDQWPQSNPPILTDEVTQRSKYFQILNNEIFDDKFSVWSSKLTMFLLLKYPNRMQNFIIQHSLKLEQCCVNFKKSVDKQAKIFLKRLLPLIVFYEVV